MGRPSPTNQAHMYRALLHQNQYNLLQNEEALPLIDPKCTEPYYNWRPSPANLPQMEITLLHHPC